MKTIESIITGVRRVCEPEKIYVFSKKSGTEGKISSVKLCVIASGEARKNEKAIYLEVDVVIPYDVLVYSPEQWATYTADPHSFAYTIMKQGELVYEREA